MCSESSGFLGWAIKHEHTLTPGSTAKEGPQRQNVPGAGGCVKGGSMDQPDSNHAETEAIVGKECAAKLSANPSSSSHFTREILKENRRKQHEF